MELRAMMDRFMGELTPSQGSSAEDEAEELVYEAMEARSLASQKRLLDRALELDGENVDALLMKLESSAMGEQARIDKLRDIVGIAARRLGEEAFREYVPHFWGHFPTRSFMRAKELLAQALAEGGFLEESLREYEEMLSLNKGDNQGVRYLLLPGLLALHRLEEARKLLAQFPDDRQWSVVFAWGEVLERVLAEDEAGAAVALAAARQQNAHLEAILRGQRKVPKNMPSRFTLGSKEEAICYAKPMLMAWGKHPRALAWLAAQDKLGGARGLN